jgi:hypothetical protein
MFTPDGAACLDVRVSVLRSQEPGLRKQGVPAINYCIYIYSSLRLIV